MLAETAFGFLRRPLVQPPQLGPEAPVDCHPVVSRLLLEKDGQAFAGLCAPGLHEYQRDARGVWLTLLRAVGFLSRDDLTCRAGDAGPMLPTPEAQCQGPQRLRYSLLLSPGAPAGELLRALEQSAVRPHALPLRQALARPRSYLVIEGEAELSALKPADVGEGAVLRTFTPLPGAAPPRAHWAAGAALRETPCDLAEEPLPEGSSRDFTRSGQVLSAWIRPSR